MAGSNQEDWKTVSTDVLVIGAGGAGLRAAIAAHDGGAKVIILGRSLRGKAHTVMAEGGINAALGNLDPEDNWKVYATDTIVEGEFLSNPKMAEVLAREASDRIFELERFGVMFDRTPDGKIMQRPFGAHTYRRTCHIADRSGLEIMQTLLDETSKRGITIGEETYITSLLTGPGKKKGKRRISGATTVNFRTGEFYIIKAKSVVVASGGYARIYKITSSPGENYGAGPFLAYHAGAKLMDMEMIQFHPTGMIWPETAKGILVTEAVRGEGGILTNSKGERFMERYDAKRMELSARDIVSRANYTEIKEGRGTPNGGVYLDISHKPAAFIKKKLGKMVKLMLDFQNLDITKEPIEVAPTAHYTMGGIRVDPETSMTRVEGLFAAGEVASGIHGANRLGGNSLTDLLVFGKITGENAGRFATETTQGPIDIKAVKKEYERITKPLNRKSGIRPTEIQDEVKELMWDYTAIERSERGLKTALKELEKIIKIKVPEMVVPGGLRLNPGWLDYLDVLSMVLVCEAVILSALERRESRGTHMRTDYPEMKPEWHVNLSCEQKGGKMIISKNRIPEVTGELKRWFQSQNISQQ